MVTLGGAAFCSSADSLQPQAVSILCRGAGGRDAGREIVDAEDTRGATAAARSGAAATGRGAKPEAEPGSGPWLYSASSAGGAGLAVGRDLPIPFLDRVVRNTFSGIYRMVFINCPCRTVINT